jgi:hypothetical protein
MVILNNNSEQQVLHIGRFQQGVGVKTKGKDVISGAEIDLTTKTLNIGAKTPMILELY